MLEMIVGPASTTTETNELNANLLYLRESLWEDSCKKKSFNFESGSNWYFFNVDENNRIRKTWLKLRT